MTDESDFHAALDACPEAHHLRLVFADWLEEHAAPPRPCGRCRGEGRAYTTAGGWGACETCRGTGELSDGRRERAEGYRALGVMGIKASHTTGHESHDRASHWWFGDAGDFTLQEAQRRQPFWEHRDSILPRDWFRLIEGGEKVLGVWRMFLTRREAEDAAAIAFAKLPEARRRELLTPALEAA